MVALHGRAMSIPDTDGADEFAGNLTRRTSLRLSDGWVGFDDEALYLDRDDERTKLSFENISELSFRDTDYFIVVLSLVLVGFGLWFLSKSPLSILFTVVGLASLYRLYTHRNELIVRASGRAKPLTFHPEDPDAFYEALGEAMGGEVVSDRGSLFGS
jgi:hypothetical protein